jgi:undecaprenyl-diphosphatase
MFLTDISTSNFFAHLLIVLKEWDTWLLLKINTQWTCPFLNSLMPIWRNQNTWLPLYVFLLVFMLLNFGWRSWPWIICFIATVGLCDQVSSGILKDWVNRPRPCNDADLAQHINFLLNYRPTGGSFTSSHATNHFGMAIFVYQTLKTYFKNWTYLFFFWAASISYAQVYVGVHFPLDIICGAVLGCLLGSLVAYIFKRWIGLPAILQEQTTTAL